MPFLDRSDAGRQLAGALAGYKDQHPVILALPRGGRRLPFAASAARALCAASWVANISTTKRQPKPSCHAMLAATRCALHRRKVSI